MDRQSAISKRHLSMVAKFNEELIAFAKMTEEQEATLYEDAFTSYTLSNVRVEDGFLVYVYDGNEEREDLVWEEDGEFTENETDGIVESIKFWRACLKRARRYWEMSVDKLDAIQDGTIEDEGEDE